MSNVPALRKSLESDPAEEVRDTCRLALRKIEEENNDVDTAGINNSPYMSVDPAMPTSIVSSVDQLRYHHVRSLF